MNRPSQSSFREVPHGLMFHHFHGPGHPPGQGSIDRETFADILEFVGLKRILPAERWLELALAGKLPDGALCVTLDDGLPCQRDLAVPVLEALNLTAFIFPYSRAFEGWLDPLELHRYVRVHCYPDVDAFYAHFDAVLAASAHAEAAARTLERFEPRAYYPECPFFSDGDKRFRYQRDEALGPSAYHELMGRLMDELGVAAADLRGKLCLGAGEIRALGERGHVVGLHTHSHPTNLAAMAPEAQRAEYADNLSALAGIIPGRPVVAAHPCGSYGPETLDILRDLGIKIAFRSNMNHPRRRGLEWPRQNHANILIELRADDPATPPTAGRRRK